MPIIKSAIKRAKQTIKRRERNVGIKREVKDTTKAFIANPTAKGFSAAQSEIDTAFKKGLLKKNTAARRKCQLSKIAKEAGVKFAATEKATPKVTDVKPEAVKKPTVVKKAAVSKTTAPKAKTVKKTVTKKSTK